jgi:hypothetical protein
LYPTSPSAICAPEHILSLPVNRKISSNININTVGLALTFGELINEKACDK